MTHPNAQCCTCGVKRSEKKLYGSMSSPDQCAECIETQWTPELVRQKLPLVRVEHNGRIIISKVVGRQNRFATVIIDGLEVEYAWTTIARTLNHNRTLRT